MDRKTQKILTDFHRKQIAAYQKRDVNAFLDLWAEDAVMIPSTSRRPLSPKKSIRSWIASNMQIPRYTLKVLGGHVSGDLAYEYGTYSGTNTNARGQTARFSGNMTRVLKKQRNGSWKIVHAMWKDA